MTWETKSDQHARASRMLNYALTLGDQQTWIEAAAVWAARLTSAERSALAFAALKSLNSEHAALAVNAAITGTVHTEGE